MSQSLKIGNKTIGLGEREVVQLDVAKLYDFTEMSIPIEVIRGEKPGPAMFISGALHGDEINGVEIVRRISQEITFKDISGTLILVPVVNIFGFNSRSRYLPDRRDLNRSFPGNPKGSLASRIAHIFMKEVVSQCEFGIDLHTGSMHRSNLPQIRAYLDDSKTKKLAQKFGAPAIVHSELRDGSLREAARKRRVTMLLFEGGEALRFDESAIKCGMKGCYRVMKEIGIFHKKVPPDKKGFKSLLLQDSFWLRAPHSGSLRAFKDLGDSVKKGEVLGVLQDLWGREKIEITSPEAGLVIGKTVLPLMNKGDAVFHIGTASDLSHPTDGLYDLEFFV
ncbi:MAG: succinylglutamate desuccinylase/aspartoacylase family protein [Bdellovibrionales bacterium]|nr:succinylglutamate desuccinylase/aspartoacylase family protein [Bdellovibrionales bacterium]